MPKPISILASLASLSQRMADHIREEEHSLGAVNQKLDALSTDVKSLLETRSFTRGMWRAVVVVTTLISGLVSMFIAYINRH